MECNGLSKVLLLFMLLSGLMTFMPITEVEAQPDTISVVVSIASLEAMVKPVGDSYVSTSTIMPQGVEPHEFTITPEDVAAAENADLLVLTGHFQWEEDLIQQVTTPFITFNDSEALANYEDFGARFSPLPGRYDFNSDTNDTHHESDNPHAWWMLPANAIAIANTTREALTLLDTLKSDTWMTNFNAFVTDVYNFLELIDTVNQEYSFSTLHAIAVFPAEAYIAETFGIEVEAVLQEEGIFIAGQALLEVQEGLRNGSIDLILGSDVAMLQAGGDFAYQLAQDYGTKLVWWKTLFTETLSDYVAVMTINLGALTTVLDESLGGQPSEAYNIALVAVTIVLGVIVVLETILLVQRARSE